MRRIPTASARTLCLTLFGALAAGVVTPSFAADDVIAQGKVLSFDRTKGNCLACHMIEGGDLPGTIGPPLIAMQARYPGKAKLRAQIYDATQGNPNSMMPPFGRHGILTPAEIDKVVEFIYTL